MFKVIHRCCHTLEKSLTIRYDVIFFVGGAWLNRSGCAAQVLFGLANRLVPLLFELEPQRTHGWGVSQWWNKPPSTKRHRSWEGLKSWSSCCFTRNMKIKYRLLCKLRVSKVFDGPGRAYLCKEFHWRVLYTDNRKTVKAIACSLTTTVTNLMHWHLSFQCKMYHT